MTVAVGRLVPTRGNRHRAATVQVGMNVEPRRPRTRRALEVLAVAALAVGASSCGGSADDPVAGVGAESTAPTTLTTTTAAAAVTRTEPTTTTSVAAVLSIATSTTLERATDPPTTVTTTPPPPSTPLPSVVAAAIDDLSAFLGVAAGDIDVARFESVTWRDGSLGCPSPGRAYTQALVDGYRIELVAGQVTYWYHGASGTDPFRCDDPSEPVDGSTGDK